MNRKPRVKKDKGPSGRPVNFSEPLANEICERLSDGESLRSICTNQHMPNKAQVFAWLTQNPIFADQYARAREAQADSLADDVTHISDRDDLDPNDKRIRIDARKWLAGKMRPKKYGDKLELAGDQENPLTVMLEAGKTLDAKLERFIAGRTGRAEG